MFLSIPLAAFAQQIPKPHYWLYVALILMFAGGGGTMVTLAIFKAVRKQVRDLNIAIHLHLPLLTTDEIDAIINPTIGLMAYDKDLNQIYYFDGAKWIHHETV